MRSDQVNHPCAWRESGARSEIGEIQAIVGREQTVQVSYAGLSGREDHLGSAGPKIVIQHRIQGVSGSYLRVSSMEAQEYSIVEPGRKKVRRHGHFAYAHALHTRGGIHPEWVESRSTRAPDEVPGCVIG